MSPTTEKMFERLYAAQAARKAAFLQSGRMPWSREEWRWSNETQQEMVQQPAQDQPA